MTTFLWTQLHDLFDTDDGSLPEIRISYSDSNATTAGYALLRRRASHLSGHNPCFYSKIDGAERHIDSVPNAAVLVVSGQAESFHVVLAGIREGDAVIPDLGVCAFPDQLALDYRMGTAWGPAELEALFGLLAELTALDRESQLSLEDAVLPDAESRFRTAWRQWKATRAT